MPVIRLILLLVVLGGLTLLLTQNWSPVLPLVFLGVKTQALPLAIWILISIAAGAFTSLFITSLFKLSNHFGRSSKRRYVSGASAQYSQPPKTAASQPKPDDANSTDTDDWSSGTTDDDDWDFEDEPDKTRDSTQNTVKDSTTSKVSTEPKTSNQSGAYSYSYQEPSNSGVGKTESVYDADYRVLTPPYQQKKTAPEDEEWDFGDDNDFEDESDPPNSRR